MFPMNSQAKDELPLFNREAPCVSIAEVTTGLWVPPSRSRVLKFFYDAFDFFSEKAYFSQNIELKNVTVQELSSGLASLECMLCNYKSSYWLSVAVYSVIPEMRRQRLAGKEVYLVTNGSGEVNGWIPTSYVSESWKSGHFFNHSTRTLTLSKLTAEQLLALNRFHLCFIDYRYMCINDLSVHDVENLKIFASHYGSDELKEEVHLLKAVESPLPRLEEHHCSKWFDPKQPEDSIRRFMNRCTFLSSENQGAFFRDIQSFFSDLAHNQQTVAFSNDFLPFFVNSGRFSSPNEKAWLIHNVEQVAGKCFDKRLSDDDRFYPVLGYITESLEESSPVCFTQLSGSIIKRSHLKLEDNQVRIQIEPAARSLFLTPEDQELNIENAKDLLEVLRFALDSEVSTWTEKATRAVRETVLPNEEVDAALLDYLDRKDIRRMVVGRINAKSFLIHVPELNTLTVRQLCGYLVWRLESVWSESVFYDRDHYVIHSKPCGNPTPGYYAQRFPKVHDEVERQLAKVEEHPHYVEVIQLFLANRYACILHKEMVQDRIIRKVVNELYRDSSNLDYAREILSSAIHGYRNTPYRFSEDCDRHEQLYKWLKTPEVVQRFINLHCLKLHRKLLLHVGWRFFHRQKEIAHLLWEELGSEVFDNKSFPKYDRDGRIQNNKFFDPQSVFKAIFLRGSFDTFHEFQYVSMYHFLQSQSVQEWATKQGYEEDLLKIVTRLKKHHRVHTHAKIEPFREQFERENKSLRYTKLSWRMGLVNTSDVGHFLFRLAKDIAFDVTYESFCQKAHTRISKLRIVETQFLIDFLKEERCLQRLEKSGFEPLGSYLKRYFEEDKIKGKKNRFRPSYWQTLVRC